MSTSSEQILLNMLGNPHAVGLLPRSPVELYNGDRMSREEFHRLYEQAPPDFKAELIGGTVYVASPLKLAHGEPHLLLGVLLVAYSTRTPGVRPSDNTTVLLGDDAEVQPDLLLRVLPEYGGQSATKDGYVMGGPELVMEVAHSSRAVDLHSKKSVYARSGVREYLAYCVAERQLKWFDLTADKELQADDSGICRLKSYPGLWINGTALAAYDYAQMIATLEQGLATPEHAAFVAELAARKK